MLIRQKQDRANWLTQRVYKAQPAGAADVPGTDDQIGDGFRRVHDDELPRVGSAHLDVRTDDDGAVGP